MKTSKVFALALENIERTHALHTNPLGTNYRWSEWGPGGLYICIELSHLCNQERITEMDAIRCREIIESRLGGGASIPAYDRWVHKHHPKVYRASQRRGTVDFDANTGRIAWLKSLIAEFRAKGD